MKHSNIVNNKNARNNLQQIGITIPAAAAAVTAATSADLSHTVHIVRQSKYDTAAAAASLAAAAAETEEEEEEEVEMAPPPPRLVAMTCDDTTGSSGSGTPLTETATPNSMATTPYDVIHHNHQNYCATPTPPPAPPPPPSNNTTIYSPSKNLPSTGHQPPPLPPPPLPPPPEIPPPPLSPHLLPQPGPAEPVLAKQKHHHRKAFEYISKALKLDEEDPSRKEQAIELYKKGQEMK